MSDNTLRGSGHSVFPSIRQISRRGLITTESSQRSGLGWSGMGSPLFAILAKNAGDATRQTRRDEAKHDAMRRDATRIVNYRRRSVIKTHFWAAVWSGLVGALPAFRNFYLRSDMCDSRIRTHTHTRVWIYACVCVSACFWCACGAYTYLFIPKIRARLCRGSLFS